MLCLRRVTPPRLLCALTLGTSLQACSADPVGSSPAIAAPTTNQLPPTIADTAAAMAQQLAELASRPDRGALQPMEAQAVATPFRATPFATLTTPGPWAVAVDGRGLGVASNIGFGLITFFDVSSATELARVPVNFLPTGLAFSPGGDKVYVGTQGGSLDVVDVATKRVTRFPLLGDPFVPVPDPNGKRIFVAMGYGAVLALDPATGQVLKSSAQGVGINGLAVNSAGTRLYSTNFGGGQLFELSATSLETLRVWDLGGTTQAVSVNPAGTLAVVANEVGYVSEVDLVTGAYKNYATAGPAFGTAPNTSFSVVQLTLTNSGRFQGFQTQTRSLRGALRYGTDLRRAAFDALTRTFVVTDPAGKVYFVKS